MWNFILIFSRTIFKKKLQDLHFINSNFIFSCNLSIIPNPLSSLKFTIYIFQCLWMVKQIIYPKGQSNSSCFLKMTCRYRNVSAILVLVVNISNFYERANSTCTSTLKNISFFCLHSFCLSFLSMHQWLEQAPLKQVNLLWIMISWSHKGSNFGSNLQSVCTSVVPLNPMECC